jgi:hypothetical protein
MNGPTQDACGAPVVERDDRFSSFANYVLYVFRGEPLYRILPGSGSPLSYASWGLPAMGAGMYLGGARHSGMEDDHAGLLALGLNQAAADRVAG